MLTGEMSGRGGLFKLEAREGDCRSSRLAARAPTVRKQSGIGISCAAMYCAAVASHANCGREARDPRSGSCSSPIQKELLV